MPITLSYAEESTGIVLRSDGTRELDAATPYSETACDVPGAINRIAAYLSRAQGAGAWIERRESHYRVMLPEGTPFLDWLERA